MKTKLARLVRMSRRELAWRSRAATRIAIDRARCAMTPPRWDRRALPAALARTPDVAAAYAAASRGRWQEAHEAILAATTAGPARFPIAPGMREAVAARIRTACPEAAASAAKAADRIVAGQYDLLGYEGLRFGTGATPDWHLDPVHDRRPPKVFWSSVPFLSPESGDHKIIWELNRHQHWLTLGRAFWLTGDARYRDVAIAQLASWLDANPPLVGVNWASMLELAFRTISWLWALNFFAGTSDESATPWAVDLVLALDCQLEQIERNLSSYFSPNTHLLGEALALYVGGIAAPCLRRADARACTGRRILIAEIGRQISGDGGHCERSTHYHRYALDFYLLALVVARISGDPAAEAFAGAATRLAEAARLLADGRGILPHLGDDDGGAMFPVAGHALDDVGGSLEVAAALLGRPDLRAGGPTEEAMWLLAHPMFGSSLDGVRGEAPGPEPASAALPDTGYYVSRSAAGAHVVLDAGPHGYLNAGHAHADALSMTLSLRGTPFLIDPGTYCYTIDPGARDRMRSTAMHNTLMLDERPASIPGGPFHWLRSAAGTVHRWHTGDRFDYIDASHDGYAPTRHRRRVLSLHDDLIVVADLVSGEGVRRADVHWHLDPQWTIALGSQRATGSLGSERVEVVAPMGDVERFIGDAESGLGWHAPVYGRLEPASTLRITRTARAPFWIVTVFGLRTDNPIDRVEMVPVWSAAGVLDHSLAIKVSRSASTDCIVIGEAREPARRATWRAFGVETDAALLFCRWPAAAEDSEPEVAMVGGDRARGTGRVRFSIDVRERQHQTGIDRDTLTSASIGRPHVRDRGIR